MFSLFFDAATPLPIRFTPCRRHCHAIAAATLDAAAATLMPFSMLIYMIHHARRRYAIRLLPMIFAAAAAYAAADATYAPCHALEATPCRRF